MGKTIGSYAYKLLCAKLRWKRQLAGLTQNEVAAKLNKKQPFVAKVENGQRRLDVIEYALYCDAIEYDLASAWPDAVTLARKHPRATSRGKIKFRYTKPSSQASSNSYTK